MTLLKEAAIIGGGVIGAGWVARLVENGIHVSVYDPATGTRKKVAAVLKNSRHAYGKLTNAARPREGKCIFVDSISQAVEGADWIVESVPENLDVKRSVYAEIEKDSRPEATITSSTSGIMPSVLQERMKHPGRFLVAHPFNPVYLLPLVEIVGGQETAAETIESARALLISIGMHPLHVKKEIEAFIADRLLEAMWRESLWLIRDGIASTADVDDAVRFGFGLRFAQMGLFETYRLAGGEDGMRHFMKQFGPCLHWPWTKLTDVPELTDELIDLVADQSEEQSGHMTIRELERACDENLIAIMHALQRNDWGAGKTLARYEQRLIDRAKQAAND